MFVFALIVFTHVLIAACYTASNSGSLVEFKHIVLETRVCHRHEDLYSDQLDLGAREKS